MRIIAGKYRRRKLHVNPGAVTRPITDRVKETLFEHLQHYLAGKRIADIFSGTGSMGLEALSRGASGAVFVEQDRRAHELLKQNVAELGVEAETLCWRADVLRCSFRPKNVPHLVPFDVIFFDPPYRMVSELAPGTPLYKSLERLAKNDVSSPDAMLVFRTPEHATFNLSPLWQPWEELSKLDLSTMEIHLFQKTQMTNDPMTNANVPAPSSPETP